SNDENIQTLINKQTLIHLIDEFDQRTQDISGLIAGPQTKETTPNTPQTNSNFQTIETKETTEPSSPHFDLLWDYPVLIWFLAELYAQNIFNFKVEKIIGRLIEPLTDDQNLPKLNCNRLLLSLALTKLHQTIGTIETTEKS